MKTSFLDYYKIILDKVSFDRALFTKEYKKAISKIKKSEISDLNNWLKAKGFQPILSETSGDRHLHNRKHLEGRPKRIFDSL